MWLLCSTEDEELEVCCSSSDEDCDQLARSSGESEDESEPPPRKKAKNKKHEAPSALRSTKKSPPTLVLPEKYDWNAVDIEPETVAKSISSDVEMTEEKVSKTKISGSFMNTPLKGIDGMIFVLLVCTY